jgi:hypothetical protein
VLAADPEAVIVGAPSDRIAPDARRGAAYVYERAGDGWLPPSRLTAGTLLDAESFGASVAVDGDVVAVGSLVYGFGEWGEPITSDGAVRVFEKRPAGWTEVAQLTRPGSQEPNGEFGSSVAIAGDTLFASAPLLREVHVFQRLAGQWTWTQRLQAPALSSGRFGERVRAMEGDLWVSAPDYESPQRGPLYRFSRAGGAWTLAQSMNESRFGQEDAFGVDFAVAGGIAFIGVPSATGYAPFVGRAGRVEVRMVNLFGSGFEE